MAASRDLFCCLPVRAWPQTLPAAAPSLCSNSRGAPACQGPANDLKAARQAFARGLKLEKSQNIDQAFYEFEEAARLVPQNLEYLTAREMTRQHLAGMHLQRGNSDLLAMAGKSRHWRSSEPR